ADQVREGGDGTVDLLGRGPAAGGDRPQAFAGRGEHAPEEHAVEVLFAPEVVVEHRLVDASPAGDAVDASATEATLREFGGGGEEDAVGGDAGVARHPCNKN